MLLTSALKSVDLCLENSDFVFTESQYKTSQLIQTFCEEATKFAPLCGMMLGRLAAPLVRFHSARIFSPLLGNTTSHVASWFLAMSTEGFCMTATPGVLQGNLTSSDLWRGTSHATVMMMVCEGISKRVPLGGGVLAACGQDLGVILVNYGFGETGITDKVNGGMVAQWAEARLVAIRMKVSAGVVGTVCVETSYVSAKYELKHNLEKSVLRSNGRKQAQKRFSNILPEKIATLLGLARGLTPENIQMEIPWESSTQKLINGPQEYYMGRQNRRSLDTEGKKSVSTEKTTPTKIPFDQIIAQLVSKPIPEEVSTEDILRIIHQQKMKTTFATGEARLRDYLLRIANSQAGVPYRSETIQAAKAALTGGRDITPFQLSANIKVEPTAAFIEHLDTLLSRNELRETLLNLVQISLSERKVALQDTHSTYMQQEAQNSPLDRTGYTKHINKAGTIFGRNFRVIEALQKMRNPNHLWNVLQMGSGIYLWEYFDSAYGLNEFARTELCEKDYRGNGLSYETTELALIGKVDLIEIDSDVIRAVQESLEKGMIIASQQPFQPQLPRITPVNTYERDPFSLQTYQHWFSYLVKFVNHPEIKGSILRSATPGEKGNLGGIAQPSKELASRIRILQGDVVVHPLLKKYDLIWLREIFHYLEEDLYWVTLIRAIHSLPIMSSNQMGGLLVTERFDLSPIYKNSPIEGRLGEFLTAAGMRIITEIESPLELASHTSTVIAERVNESEWLENQIIKFRKLGIQTV